MAIVSCPECSKKLKVSDTSVGKKVKCSCGHVFVAMAEAAAAVAAVAAEKVFVACTACTAKLKVATTSLGKKMKCPKCASVFTAQIEEEAPAFTAPPPEEDDDFPPPVKGKAKPVTDDDMDDFAAFAAAESPMASSDDEDDAPKARTKAKAKSRMADDEDDEEDMPKSKAKPVKRPLPADDDDDDKPVYPGRILQNILVTLMLLFLAAVFGVLFFGEDLGIDPAKEVGIPPAKGLKVLRKLPVDGKKEKGAKTDDGGNDKEKKNGNTDKGDDKGKNGDDKKVPEKNGDDKKQPAEKNDDAAILEGAWIIESAIVNGEADNTKLGEPLKFSDGKIGLGADPIPFVLGMAGKLKTIDVTVLVGPNKMLTIPGIYKLEGDKLYLSLPTPDAGAPKRPANFDGKIGMTTVLRRAAKDDSTYSRIESQNNLKMIALATHSFHDTHKRFPAVASSDAAGKPLLSWRVAILPYVEQENLYAQFDLTKPWDDPHNMKLIARMPKIYEVPGVKAKEGMTHYRALMGFATPLEPQKGPGHAGKNSLLTLVDGTTNVILAVEAKEPTIWTKPDDLPYEAEGPLPKFGVAPIGFNVAMCDGRVLFVDSKTTEKVLRPYLTYNNAIPREPLEADAPKGKIKTPRPPAKDKDADKDKRKIEDEKKDGDKVSSNKAEQARIAAAKAQIKALSSAVDAFYIKHLIFPQTLAQLVEKDEFGIQWLESKDVLLDPWKRPIQYDREGPKNNALRADIWTITPDKQVIGNWKTADAGK